jgi:hypothetical protein
MVFLLSAVVHSSFRGALIFPSLQPALREPAIGAYFPHSGPGARPDYCLMRDVMFRLYLNINEL